MNFRGEREALEVRIELTPLIDVVFQLLIFFLLTSSFITEGALEVELPETTEEPAAPREQRVLAVSIARDGTLACDDKPVSLAQLAVLFRQAAADPDGTTVIVRGDHAVNHGRVVEVMDLARVQGVTTIGIATVPKRDESEPTEP